jgi:uronate dehydrogenase
MKRILITGAAGNAARMIRPILSADYRLRLSDVRPLADAAATDEVATANLGDMAALRAAVSGVDGIVHLGAYALETGWETIHAANIVGTYNLFEAARLEGVRRVVFASSGHAVGFYLKTRTIAADVTVRPDSRYGLSKAFGEAVASLYAYKYGAEVLSIRIGTVSEKPAPERRLAAIWLSPRDLCQLIRIGLEAPGIRHEIVYGASANKACWWDNANALRLGYRPEDCAEDHDTGAVSDEATGDPRADLNQGGVFCSEEEITTRR